MFTGTQLPAPQSKPRQGSGSTDPSDARSPGFRKDIRWSWQATVALPSGANVVRAGAPGTQAQPARAVVVDPSPATTRQRPPDPHAAKSQASDEFSTPPLLSQVQRSAPSAS